MNRFGGLRKVGASSSDERQSSPPPECVPRKQSLLEIRNPASALFRTVWYVGNVLLILATLLAAYSAVWEYSTRKYLKGFSDAVVPVSASAEEKAEAILQWMSTGPARRAAGPDPSSPDRDPTDTLNYTSLLRVCGTATNAFINLSDSAGLAARRLLLLNSAHMTKHVVAEVLVDGRWSVVDPAFRTIFRGTDGGLLTKEQLSNPTIFSAATRGIQGYSADYTFENTEHVRMIRLGRLGIPLRSVLNRLVPGWEDSTPVSLLMERESLDSLVIALVLISILGLLRIGLRWYGETRFGVRPVRVRQQIRRAFHAFFDTA
jgi:hypothetical protein